MSFIHAVRNQFYVPQIPQAELPGQHLIERCDPSLQHIAAAGLAAIAYAGRQTELRTQPSSLEVSSLTVPSMFALYGASVVHAAITTTELLKNTTAPNVMPLQPAVASESHKAAVLRLPNEGIKHDVDGIPQSSNGIREIKVNATDGKLQFDVQSDGRDLHDMGTYRQTLSVHTLTGRKAQPLVGVAIYESDMLGPHGIVEGLSAFRTLDFMSTTISR